MFNYSEHSINTEKRECWIDITGRVQSAVKNSGIENGLAVVNSLHTTAGITINENADPDVGGDFFSKLSSLVPRDPSFRHIEGNSDSHIKSSLVGFHVQVPVQNSSLILGRWQSVYFCEFDGPRKRRYSVCVSG